MWPFPFPLELRLAASFLGAGTLPEARHGGLAEAEVARDAGVELPWGTWRMKHRWTGANYAGDKAISF